LKDILYEPANFGEDVGPESPSKTPHYQFSHADLKQQSFARPNRHEGLINHPSITFDRNATLNSFAIHRNPGMY
jgi:hypothetical protein